MICLSIQLLFKKEKELKKLMWDKKREAWMDKNAKKLSEVKNKTEPSLKYNTQVLLKSKTIFLV